MNGTIRPFREFVIKVASRCDLACDHCYVYEHADQGWRKQPRFMSDRTVAHIAERIADHAREHRLEVVHVIMHGGEPLLAGPSRLKRFAEELELALDGVSVLDLRIHTNGVLLSEEFCEVFDAANVKVGISLDGDRVANDRHRLYANGRSSYDHVLKAINLLRERYPQLYAGVLCTVDILNDPVAVYTALLALEPPRIDFLLPHATWDRPPPHWVAGGTAYADWLIKIYDQWVSDGRPIAIRLFDSIASVAMGTGSKTESLGLKPSDLVVIEADGTYEQADSLKIAYDGAPAMGMNVFDQSLNEAARYPGVGGRLGDASMLARECQECPLVTSCGGGLYAHRYRTGTDFANPSVYCSDLFKLIPHVEQETIGRPHMFPLSALRVLAGAEGGSQEAERLRAPQLSLTRRAVHTKVQATGDSASWEIFARLRREHQKIADEVLEHPYVRSWASAWAELDRPLHAGPGQLAGVAAAIAIHAGEPLTIAVPVSGGLVHLPTLGRMRVGDVTSALVETADGVFEVGAAGRRHSQASANWEPLRVLVADGISLPLDDVDPHRACYEAPVSDRLTEDEFARWQWLFGVAWELLRNKYPDQAAAVRAGLRVMTPLADKAVRVVTSRDAYGAIAVPEPPDAETMAMLMVGGLRSGQLRALQAMFDLTGRDARVTERLQQAHGRLAVVDFLGQSVADTALRDVQDTLRELAEQPLPDIGREFLHGMCAAAAARLERNGLSGSAAPIRESG
ncbi:FxsB family cyclophane-forming radical SAM/SPASM peptide maturase [Sphaerisporangium aureirubrum]|uniref:FxsB family cyclophane-forming radical SAM/SPASM peptide maturase n=1 Tax=Sphaerisporangium aureirubrum TaxID=1544736 RepID=A0ABW1NII2_9ACTN